MKDPMNPFEGKVFTSVDEGYNVTVYRTPKELQNRLLNLGKFCGDSNEDLSTIDIMIVLEKKGCNSFVRKRRTW